jgi:hypothetical protein
MSKEEEKKESGKIEVGKEDGPTIQQHQERNYLRPPNMLEIDPKFFEKLNNEGIRPLWAAPEMVDHHEWEGYSILERPSNVRGQPGKGISQEDRSYRSREMVLMGIREEGARQMEQMESELSERQIEAATDRWNQRKEEMAHSIKKRGYSDRETKDIMSMFEVNIGRERVRRR